MHDVKLERPVWFDAGGRALDRAIEEGLAAQGITHTILTAGALADERDARDRRETMQRKLRAAHRKVAEWMHGSHVPVPHLTWTDTVKRPATAWKGNDQCNPPTPNSLAMRQIAACLAPQHTPPARSLPLSKNLEPKVPGTYYVPSAPQEACALKKATWWVRRQLRPISRYRVRGCGWAIVPGERDVAIVVGPTGTPRYSGVLVCGCGWECPTCASRIRAGRAAELRQAIEAHGGEEKRSKKRTLSSNVVMLTLTISHGLGDDLKHMRSALGDAYRGLTRGKTWAKFKRDAGISGSIRGLEVTHGQNGWHPHLHVVLLRDAALPKKELRKGGEWWPTWRAWLFERWRTMVVRYIGPEHAPDPAVGISLKHLNKVTYLAKLGLELADPLTKQGKNGNRSPWQIARDYADRHEPTDGELWRSYCAGMRGAQQLCWTAGLKRRLGVREKTDEELADEGGVTKIVMRIPRDAWRLLRSVGVVVAGQHRDASEWILAIVASEGERAAQSALLEVIERAPSSTRLVAAVNRSNEADAAADRADVVRLVGELYLAAAERRCREVSALERVARTA